MRSPPKVIAFDVDYESGIALRNAFPEWELVEIQGATPNSLDRDWSPGAADLLVVGAREQEAETLGLCRGLRNQAGRAHAPVLVLVPPAQKHLINAVLEAGANSCLVLPVHPKDLLNAIAHPREGNRPGRHTLGLDRPQREDAWRDAGGEA
jgi:DNA-binding response OmpR family regulator